MLLDQTGKKKIRLTEKEAAVLKPSIPYRPAAQACLS